MNPRETLNQLTNSSNGINRLKVMIGAKNFAASKSESCVTFRFTAKAKNKANHCKITLNVLDLYDVKFYNIRGINLKEISTHNNIYNDMLKELFERETELYLSL